MRYNLLVIIWGLLFASSYYIRVFFCNPWHLSYHDWVIIIELPSVSYRPWAIIHELPFMSCYPTLGLYSYLGWALSRVSFRFIWACNLSAPIICNISPHFTWVCIICEFLWVVCEFHLSFLAFTNASRFRFVCMCVCVCVISHQVSAHTWVFISQVLLSPKNMIIVYHIYYYLNIIYFIT